MSHSEIKTKNVLMTTLSTLNNKNQISYYFYDNPNNEKKFICTGIGSIEAGSKYILCTETIDKIVVVGSDKTIVANDDLNSKELLNISLEEKELHNLTNLSSYEFYTKRITGFLQNKEDILNECALNKYNENPPINEERKEEIRKIVKKELEKNTNFEKILDNNNYNNLLKTIQENINAKLIDSEYEYAYAKYIIYKSFNNHPSPKNNNITIHFVPETIQDEKDNITELVHTLCEPNERINLYIDMQGGNRTSNYLRNVVLSILTNQLDDRVFLKKIVATKFEFSNYINEIVDETQRYKIIDLASGMNAFIRYGKADIINKYCSDVDIEDSTFKTLVYHMVDIDSALSLCDINSLVRKIIQIKILFARVEKNPNNNNSPTYQVFLDGIRQDYKNLIDNIDISNIDINVTDIDNIDIDNIINPSFYLYLIEWSVEKGFIQQALTLIESKMPKVYFDKKWIHYQEPLNEDEETFIQQLGKPFEDKENKIFYSLYNPSNNKYIFQKLWQYYFKKKFYYSPEYIKPFDKTKLNEFKKQLETYSYTHIYECNFKELVNNLKTTLVKEKDLSNFLFLYCKFHSIESYYQNCIYSKEGDAIQRLASYYHDTFFYMMENNKPIKNQNYQYKDPNISFTILSCIGPHKYYLNNNSTLIFTLNIHEKLDYKQNHKTLDELFMLHDALKKERNCNNHASDRIRLPKDVVETAIKLYITKFKEIQKLIKE